MRTLFGQELFPRKGAPCRNCCEYDTGRAANYACEVSQNCDQKTTCLPRSTSCTLITCLMSRARNGLWAEPLVMDFSPEELTCRKEKTVTHWWRIRLSEYLENPQSYQTVQRAWRKFMQKIEESSIPIKETNRKSLIRLLKSCDNEQVNYYKKLCGIWLHSGYLIFEVAAMGYKDDKNIGLPTGQSARR